ncbi:MAG: DUF2177 family protein [Candidatus Pacebacteria bacterium]|nr:DUF2177 family protein [Candidatus Paceibacterota bacterium]
MKNKLLNFFITYLLLLAIFGLVDAIWLGLVAKNFYTKELGDLLRADFLLFPGLIFYAMHPLMIWFFGFKQSKSFRQVLLNTAIYGLGAYATYDLSNWATLKNWSEQVVMVDIIWGSVSSMTVAGIVWFLVNKKLLHGEIKS